jgi:cytochrome c
MNHRLLMIVPAALGALALLPAAAPPTAAGALLYRQRCQMCHGTTTGAPTPMGPSLAGVVGRKAGSTRFAYSPALKAANVTWNRATLDTYLAGPTKMFPGSRMMISVPDAKQRADIIAYLTAPN